MVSDHPVDRLSEMYMIPIIMFLYKNGNSKKTDIYRSVSRNATIPRKLDDLESMGILVQENPQSGACTNIYLTDLGTCIAERLRDINNEMKSN